jgi:dihydroorotase
MQSHAELLEEITGDKQEVIIPRWFDRHLHLRDGEMLKTVLPCTLKQHATGAVIMGNLKHPDQTSTVEKASAYRQRIIQAMTDLCFNIDAEKGKEWHWVNRDPGFQPCMTCYLTDDISPDEVVRGFKEGVWRAVKLYMANQKGQGGTTGSHAGVKDLLGRYPVFEAMEKNKIPLLGHFEAVEEDVDEFDREIVSAERDLIPLAKTFRGMPIVVEHLTDGRVADIVAESDMYLRATVTAHHLMINRNAMFWGGMNPGHYCKPVPKREKHRLAVRKHVVTDDRGRFGAGTDSAPHDEEVKSRCYGCAAGIFTAPAAVEMYTTVFDQEKALDRLGAFLSKNFIELYGMTVSKEWMTVKRIPLQIPQKIGNVQVFKGSTELPWKLAD